MLCQKIKYIDKYQSGVKCGNMGHVRVEWEDGRFRIAANLCRMDRQTIASMTLEKVNEEMKVVHKEPLANIAIIHGRGCYQSDWMPTRKGFLQLLFEGAGEVYGICELPVFEKEDEAKVSEEEKANVQEQNMQGEEVLQTMQEPPEEVQMPVYEEQPEQSPRREELREDKWEQLCLMFPKAEPMENGAQFLQIAPEDFVILRREYQSLVRNSFLLHGYYSYHHILLAKYPDKYYIGVPGILHRQEKMAAAMFGFSGFEKAKEPALPEGRRIPAGEEFGYYMMEVGI